MAKIVIVQSYVPRYRIALFEQLRILLDEAGHELVVVSGRPLGEQEEREDAVHLTGVGHATFTPKVLRVGPIQIRLAPNKRAWQDADAVVVELAAGALASYKALLGPLPTAVWGHVGNFVAPDHRLIRGLRAWQARRADEVLAYTGRGGTTALEYGARPDQVTVLRNTVDTSSLRALVLEARNRPVADVRTELDAPEGPLFSVVGGLDTDKRIDLLVATLDELWRNQSPIRFLVGGRGRQEHLLDEACRRGQAMLLGHIDDQQKALLARISIALFNPGRVGLIAVESFALGLPIITTNTPFHAPEFEYLRPGKDSLVVNADATALSTTLSSLASGGAIALAKQADSRAEEYRLEDLVERMSEALIRLVQARTS